MFRWLPLLFVFACQEYQFATKALVGSGGVDTAAPSDDASPVEPPPELPPEDTGDDGVVEDPPTDPPPADPPPEEPPPPELCDGIDNDGDGDIDEGFPDTDGDRIPDCLEVEYTLRFAVTVDDVYSAWVDGEPLVFESAGWNVLDEHTFVLNSGRHVIAVHGWDTGLAISGHLSALWVDEELFSVTGDGRWKVLPDAAPEGWTAVEYDDAGWVRPVACVDIAPWLSFAPDIMDLGAVWTWYAPDGACRAETSYGDAFYRLEITLPSAASGR